MAQKTENEETEFKVHETLSLCINNCGVTGNPATKNMCQNCFTATTTSSSVATSKILKKTPRSTRLRSPLRSGSSKPEPVSNGVETERRDDREAAPEQKSVNRCSGCRRKVGLTGFRCRCGELFCSEHRYSDRHDCSYDYKAAGREAIARENPVVKAAKIVRA